MAPAWEGKPRRVRLRIRCAGLLAGLALAAGAPAVLADSLRAQLDGVEGALREAVLANLEVTQYAGREVTPAQARRLYARVEDQVREALEPHGYYHASASGELREEPGGFVAVVHVRPGEPVRVATLDIVLDGSADGQAEVKKALAGFVPARGAPLDHSAYEKSKAHVEAALFATGYLDARLVTHRVEVTRADNTAAVHLHWQTGERYRFGPIHFEGAQFPDAFLDRYVPWNEGDFYTQDKLLELQQRLIDADYFALVQVQPDREHARDGVVPVEVMLAPAKRTIYTAGLFIGTDTGPGVRGSIHRRWVNQRGHKGHFETLVAQRLKTAAVRYQIPLAGHDNHNREFGLAFRNENTDTSRSRTFSLAATDSRLWHDWTRTLGLKFLTGNFEVANITGDTQMLYPEISLARKQADDPVFVRDGWSLTFAGRAASSALASRTDFAQVTADGKWIRGLGERGRFIARGSLGTSHAGDFDRLPPELRFFAGGDRSIRGYPYQTIGTPLPAALVPEAEARCAQRKGRSCQTLIIGGKHMVVASAEYEYYFKPAWGIATFIDAGDAFSSLGDFRQKIGAGVGLRWRSPVGMVRADIGVPVDDPHSPKSVTLHIVIGPDL